MKNVELEGVTLTFPNGVHTHFGCGREDVLMELLSKRMDRVLTMLTKHMRLVA